jgi:hypothetical protein
MKKRFFLFQDKIEELLQGNRAVLQGSTLHVLDHNNDTPIQIYRLIPAVKVLHCETSKNDPYDLVGKFIPARVLTENGVDLLLSSFTYKNQSYQIDIGYLTHL